MQVSLTREKTRARESKGSKRKGTDPARRKGEHKLLRSALGGSPKDPRDGMQWRRGPEGRWWAKNGSLARLAHSSIIPNTCIGACAATRQGGRSPAQPLAPRPASQLQEREMRGSQTGGHRPEKYQREAFPRDRLRPVKNKGTLGQPRGTCRTACLGRTSCAGREGQAHASGSAWAGGGEPPSTPPAASSMRHWRLPAAEPALNGGSGRCCSTNRGQAGRGALRRGRCRCREAACWSEAVGHAAWAAAMALG